MQPLEGFTSSCRKDQPKLKLAVAVLIASTVTWFSMANALAVPGSSSAPAEQDKPSVAQDIEHKSVEELQQSLLSGSDSFEYKVEGRPDPFMPFVTEAIVKSEKKSAAEELTGMRRFEPGQLTLVAIAYTEKGPMAMVEDSVGKGYILRKGTKIGRSGEVAEIYPSTVVIKELTFSITNQKRYKTIEMSLKKEGEK